MVVLVVVTPYITVCEFVATIRAPKLIISTTTTATTSKIGETITANTTTL